MKIKAPRPYGSTSLIIFRTILSLLKDTRGFLPFASAERKPRRSGIHSATHSHLYRWGIPRRWVKLLFLFLFIFVTGCISLYNPATQRQELYFFDSETEVTIGKNIARDIIKENKLIENRKKLAYLKAIGGKIAQVSDRSYLEYEFYIIDEKGMNAFSLPGGYIFVNRELVDKASIDELAFVLAHEIGHVAARHSMKRLEASLGVSLIFNIAFKSEYSDLTKRAVDVIYNAVSLGYSRRDEFLADSLAVKYCHRSGYNPKAGISLMKKLQNQKGDDYTLIFLRSHPPVEDRIKNIKKSIEKL